MRLTIAGLLMLLATQVSAQKKKTFDPDKKYSADSVKAWTLEIMEEIQKGHPGFYRYTSKDRFDILIDSTLQTVNDSITSIDFYRKLKPLFAQIGCLHTSVNLSENYEEHIRATSKLIPIEIFIDNEDRVFVTKVYNSSGQTSIPVKTEILSINDLTIQDIIYTLRKAIPSDGYNQTLKTRMLNHRFAFWYQSIISLDTTFNVKGKVGDQIMNYQLKGVDSDVFPSMKSLAKSNQEQLSFEIQNGIGMLTIRTFAKSVIKRNGQKFKKFLEETFQTLRDQNINNLIVDLRYNTGGTDTNAAMLASYFFDEPFDYWEKIELTEDIADQIKGVYRLFYSKPEKVDSTYHWKGSMLTKEFRHYNVEPAKNIFHGKTVLITNGFCMSSCSDLVAVLSYNGKAQIVGEESGGGYQGNTSGLMPNSEIYANMNMTIPLLKYTNAVDQDVNVGRGTIPDYVVSPSLDQWITGEDVELKYARNLLKLTY